MELYKNFPILVIDDQINSQSLESTTLQILIESLKNRGFSILESTSLDDPSNFSFADSECSCVIVSTDYKEKEDDKNFSKLDSTIAQFRERNPLIPIYLVTKKLELQNMNLNILSRIDGYIWETEDAPEHTAGRIEFSAKEYLNNQQPPFFKELVSYTEEAKYSMHAPGHTGGMAFLKSTAGRIFYQFYGENLFKGDLSIAVPELGSLLDHKGVIEKAEENAAKVFGANRTYFVTNGTSTANKIVMQGVIKKGDIVLIDRNCHKSVMYGIILAGAVPVYLNTLRNEKGIIGPIDVNELKKEVIEEKIKQNPFLTEKLDEKANKKAKLAIITNCTFDGICYNAEVVKEKLKDICDNLLFDEAWFPFAKFNPIYEKMYANCPSEYDRFFDAVYSTQSTHKLIAALSQGSMIHVKSKNNTFSHERFNDAFNMYTSTSPQYSIIASLEISTKMMEDKSGERLIQSVVEETNMFRKKMAEISEELGSWWYRVFQPEEITKHTHLKDINTKQEKWILGSKDSWHNFTNLEDNYVMLEPTKLTLLTNNLVNGKGIPAIVLAKYLRSKGIVPAKEGIYTLLFLFSMGTTKGKSGTLLAELFEFKEKYDKNVEIEKIFPDLAEEYSEIYGNKTIQDLCNEIDAHYKKYETDKLGQSIFSNLPEQVMLPSEAYQEILGKNVSPIKLDEIDNRIAAVMVVPYPPGIPVIMPGEKFKQDSDLVKYLKMFEEFENKFPGFNNTIEGTQIIESEGKTNFTILCVNS